MKSKWRAYALAVILLISVAAGLSWHYQSKDLGQANSANSGPPFLLGIYTDSPSEPISLDLNLYNNAGGTFVEVFLNAPSNDSIILVSTQQDVGQAYGPQPSFKQLFFKNGPASYYSYYKLISGNSLETGDPYGVGFFKVPDSTFIVNHDEVAAQMPLIGQYQSDSQYTPQAATLATTEGIYLAPTLESGYEVSDRNPSDYSVLSLPYAPVKDLYWNPEHLSTEEQVLGVGRQISGWNISATPPNGISDAGNYVWQGDYGLAGLLTAINPTVLDSRDSDEFLSGIALATGAAALIALLQECKDELRFRKKKEPESDDSASGGETQPPEQPEHRSVPSGLGWPQARQADPSGAQSGSNRGLAT